MVLISQNQWFWTRVGHAVVPNCANTIYLCIYARICANMRNMRICALPKKGAWPTLFWTQCALTKLPEEIANVNVVQCRPAFTRRCTLANTQWGITGSHLTHSGADLAGRDLQRRLDALCYQQRCTHTPRPPPKLNTNPNMCKTLSVQIPIFDISSHFPTKKLRGELFSRCPPPPLFVARTYSLKLVGLVPTAGINTDVVCLFSIFPPCGSLW